jgi:hypothetical protein
MGLGGVDKILVVQLSVCQFWQETGRTGMLAESVLCAPKLQLRANQKISQQPEKVWFLLYCTFSAEKVWKKLQSWI